MANFVYGNEHCWVNGSGVVEDCASDLLYFGTLVFGERWGGICCGVLCCCSVGRTCPFGGSMLWAGRGGVMKFFKSRCDVLWHGNVDVAVVVVPCEVQATVYRAVPVDADFVFRLEGVDEVMDVLFIGVFDTEIVNDEDELNVSCGMHP